jgi:PilZ domain
MLSFLVRKNDRREVRRRMTLPCRVVRERDFRLVGTNALDVSPDGMLVRTIRDVAPGDELIVAFQATELGIWFDAEAKVARVVRGRRLKDRGRCVGISFTRFDPVARLVLRGHLGRSAPPVPQRDARIDYAATVRKIAQAG